MMSWQHWLYGLANAVISGAANSVTVMVVDPDKFNLTSWPGFEHMLAVAGVGGAIGFWMYLKQSPLPAFVETTMVTSQSTVISEKAVEPPVKTV